MKAVPINSSNYSEFLCYLKIRKRGVWIKMENIKIEKAIIPAAGLGTRLHPMTQVVPKEMMSIGRKPALEYIIEELVQTGLSHILIVISVAKTIIRSYFQDGSRWNAKIEYAIQKEMRGSGDAILIGESWVNDQPFLVAWGDCVFRKIRNDVDQSVLPVKRLMDCFTAQCPDIAVLMKRVHNIKLDQYHKVRYSFIPGGLRYDGIYEQPFTVSAIVQNLRAQQSLSVFFSASSRWLLSPKIFEYLKNLRSKTTEEVLLTEAVYNLFVGGGTMWGVPLYQNELIDDIGSWEAYLAITAQEAIRDSEYGEAILDGLSSFIIRQ